MEHLLIWSKCSTFQIILKKKHYISKASKGLLWSKGLNIYSKMFLSSTFPVLFSNEMLVIMAGISKMLGKKANREDPYQTDLDLCCLGSMTGD